MLDILAELLMDLITGKQPKQKAGRPQSQGGANRANPRPAPAGTPVHETGRELTFEDLVKKIAGIEEEPPPPPKREARPEPRAEVPVRPAPPPPVTMPPKRSLVAEALENAGVAEWVDTTASRTERRESDYAARLRGNPRAARDAFVYGEIFGKPLAERDPRQSL